MKKLLVLALVLSMATMASAALQISVNGSQAAADITLAPSDTASLGIWTDAAILPGVGETYFVLVANTQVGMIDYLTGTVLLTGDGGVGLEHSVDAQGFTAGTGIDVLPPMNGIGGGVVLSVFASINSGAQIFDGIVFHCEGPGDVIVQLFATDFVTSTLVDSAVIHQLVPEPMTMGLLGLGGLFLRRRK